MRYSGVEAVHSGDRLRCRTFFGWPQVNLCICDEGTSVVWRDSCFSLKKIVENALRVSRGDLDK